MTHECPTTKEALDALIEARRIIARLYAADSEDTAVLAALYHLTNAIGELQQQQARQSATVPGA